MQKIFSGMEKAIPNFEQHRRWVLRSLDTDVLKFFEANGIDVGDLTLNEQEYEQFNQIIKEIVASSIRKVQNGTHKYWQIDINEIRIDLDEFGMPNTWLYHNRNKRDINSFEGEFAESNYKEVCRHDLQSIVMKIFDDQLCALANNSTNPNILKAKEELDKKRENEKANVEHEEDDVVL